MINVTLIYPDNSKWFAGQFPSLEEAYNWVNNEKKRNPNIKADMVDMSSSLTDMSKVTIKMLEIRNKRNVLLQNSDWTQLVDSPLDSSMKQRWRVYRQKLRDVPNNVREINIFEQPIIWPLTPEQEDIKKKS